MPQCPSMPLKPINTTSLIHYHEYHLIDPLMIVCLRALRRGLGRVRVEGAAAGGGARLLNSADEDTFSASTSPFWDPRDARAATMFDSIGRCLPLLGELKRRQMAPFKRR